MKLIGHLFSCKSQYHCQHSLPALQVGRFMYICDVHMSPVNYLAEC